MRLLIIDAERCVGCQLCMFACVRRQNEGGLAQACIAIRSIGGMERGFTVIVCRACDNPACAKVCPTNALKVQDDGGVRLDTAACIGCGNCKDACLVGAVFWDEEVNKPMICIHCGYCTKFCPHGVLKTKEKELT